MQHQQQQQDAGMAVNPHDNRLTRSAMTPQPGALMRSPSTVRSGSQRVRAQG